jgi:hypothetical protein
MTTCDIYHRAAFVIFTAVLLICGSSSSAQESGRTKVAEGEYKVTTEGDLGFGPIETEIFHFTESWTLWRTGSGYDLEGYRDYQSPRDEPHHYAFVFKLARDLQLLSGKEFAKLVFRNDSGPLTCEFKPQRLHCDSGAKDPANRVDIEYSMDHPYALIWPLSAFSLAGLTRAATNVDKPAMVQVAQLEQISDVLPVLAIRSDGLLRYLGQSQASFAVSGQSWHAKVYELTAGPVGKVEIRTSPEGLLLQAEKLSWPKSRMELVKFTKFADF